MCNFCKPDMKKSPIYQHQPPNTPSEPTHNKTNSFTFESIPKHEEHFLEIQRWWK